MVIRTNLRTTATKGDRVYVAWFRVDDKAEDAAVARLPATLQETVRQVAAIPSARAEASFLLRTLRSLNTDCRAVEVQAAGSFSVLAELEDGA